MKKNIILVLIIIVILIIGIYFYLILANANKIHNQETAEKETMLMIKNAYLGTGSISCFSGVDDKIAEEIGKDLSSDAVFFQMKEGKMRMVMNYEGSGIGENVIMKDNIVYFWGDSRGMMMEVNEDILNDIFYINFEDEEAFAENIKKLNVNCKEEEIDDRVFNLPEGIEFMSPEELVIEDIENLNLLIY